MYRAEVTPRSTFVTLRGLRQHVLHWGPEHDAAQTWFLLHGFQDCAATFQFLVDALPRDWRFIAPDLRGFGASEGTAQPYWFPDYFADLDALLELLEPAHPVRLLGHSLGGNVVSMYAGIRPERVERLISLEGFGLRRTPATQAPQRYAEWLQQLRLAPREGRYASVEALAGKLRQRNARLTSERASFIARAWTRDGDDGAVELRFDPWHRLVNPTLYRREEAEACWRRVTAPALLVLAAESEYLQRLQADGDAASLASAFPATTLVTLAGLGHMMHHEDPAAVAASIVAWSKD
jgi:pimeloyl-ACP methyl ester carboxylesterase